MSGRNKGKPRASENGRKKGNMQRRSVRTRQFSSVTLTTLKTGSYPTLKRAHLMECKINKEDWARVSQIEHAMY